LGELYEPTPAGSKTSLSQAENSRSPRSSVEDFWEKQFAKLMNEMRSRMSYYFSDTSGSDSIKWSRSKIINSEKKKVTMVSFDIFELRLKGN